MWILILLAIIVAVAFGVGAVVKGLLWLLVIGIVLFVAAFILAGAKLRGGRSRVHR